jgi:GT2 family glycosyltransferase
MRGQRAKERLARRYEAHRPGWVLGPCLLITRECFDAIQGFSENYFMYAEDIDLAWKAFRRGYLTRAVKGAAAVHVGGASARQQWTEVEIRSRKLAAELSFYCRNFSSAQNAGILCARIIRLTLCGASGEARRQDVSVLVAELLAQLGLARHTACRKFKAAELAAVGVGAESRG